MNELHVFSELKHHNCEYSIAVSVSLWQRLYKFGFKYINQTVPSRVMIFLWSSPTTTA